MLRLTAVQEQALPRGSDYRIGKASLGMLKQSNYKGCHTVFRRYDTIGEAANKSSYCDIPAYFDVSIATFQQQHAVLDSGLTVASTKLRSGL